MPRPAMPRPAPCRSDKWTPYTWEVLDSSPKFICQPRGVGPTHPEYPPKDIGTAMIKNWISSPRPG